MIASLPMYDWPEFQAATDALWQDMRDGLRAAGEPAPDALTRGADPWDDWTAADLSISQTCGWPLVRDLLGKVTVLGAFDRAMPEAEPPGHYHSVLIRRQGDAAPPRRFAFNEEGSQSGYAALVNTRSIDDMIPVKTGAHRASIMSVAANEADIAAIDCVSWAMAQQVEPAAVAALAVVGRSRSTPGLPLITRLGVDVDRFRQVLTHVATGRAARHLGITGFVAFEPEDYVRTIGIHP